MRPEREIEIDHLNTFDAMKLGWTPMMTEKETEKKKSIQH